MANKNDKSTAPNATQTGATSTRGPSWGLPFALGMVLLAIIYAKGCLDQRLARKSAAPVASSRKLAEKPYYVTITIEFGGDRPTLRKQVPWQPGMTVRSVLTSASFGTLAEKGRGESAFLVGIDGVHSEGAGGRNWMYSVNGKRGDRSFAIYQVQPNDHVLWSFSPPD